MRKLAIMIFKGGYYKCPRCGYWAFDGYECFDCGYRTHHMRGAFLALVGLLGLGGAQ